MSILCFLIPLVGFGYVVAAGFYGSWTWWKKEEGR